MADGNRLLEPFDNFGRWHDIAREMLTTNNNLFLRLLDCFSCCSTVSTSTPLFLRLLHCFYNCSTVSPSDSMSDPLFFTSARVLLCFYDCSAVCAGLFVWMIFQCSCVFTNPSVFLGLLFYLYESSTFSRTSSRILQEVLYYYDWFTTFYTSYPLFPRVHHCLYIYTYIHIIYKCSPASNECSFVSMSASLFLLVHLSFL